MITDNKQFYVLTTIGGYIVFLIFNFHFCSGIFNLFFIYGCVFSQVGRPPFIAMGITLLLLLLLLLLLVFFFRFCVGYVGITLVVLVFRW